MTSMSGVNASSSPSAEPVHQPCTDQTRRRQQHASRIPRHQPHGLEETRSLLARHLNGQILLTLSGVSAMSSIYPSTAISLRDATPALFVPRLATGAVPLSNNTRNGAPPSRCRPWVIADAEGPTHSSRHD